MIHITDKYTVKEEMPANIYDSMTAEPSKTWDSIRHFIGQKLFDNKYVMMPLLDEAWTFDVLAVYIDIKPQEASPPPQFEVVGFLRDLIVPWKCNSKRLQDIMPREESSPLITKPEFKYTLEGVKSNIRKEIELKLTGLKRVVSDVALLQPFDLFIAKPIQVMRVARELNIINDVILCSGFRLKMSINGYNTILNLERERLPIAFRKIAVQVNARGMLTQVFPNLGGGSVNKGMANPGSPAAGSSSKTKELEHPEKSMQNKEDQKDHVASGFKSKKIPFHHSDKTHAKPKKTSPPPSENPSKQDVRISNTATTNYVLDAESSYIVRESHANWNRTGRQKFNYWNFVSTSTDSLFSSNVIADPLAQKWPTTLQVNEWNNQITQHLNVNMQHQRNPNDPLPAIPAEGDH